MTALTTSAADVVTELATTATYLRSALEAAAPDGHVLNAYLDSRLHVLATSVRDLADALTAGDLYRTVEDAADDEAYLAALYAEFAAAPARVWTDADVARTRQVSFIDGWTAAGGVEPVEVPA